MKYHATFFGRPIGAIGLFRTCTRDVEAPDEKAARVALYDTHEHISGVRLEQVKEDEEKQP